METAESKSATTNKAASVSVADDVLHLGSPTQLSAEEIAKAVAHHNRRHHGDQPQKAAAKAGAGKKNR
ncbi:MAG TPA: hypothetical protein VMW15_00515 [Terracidiphilus sp.]|jgi:hypothetical protein|nr:hypothetical protein [Terracidiphilus sp.]HUX27226.1 hypothetical protein [Terracidiphilus sp.]